MEKEKNIIFGRLTFEGVYLKGKKSNGKGYEHNTNTI